jgi:8-oxo-dGTP pyrophosphatase MutT (NUDIX family)
MGASILPITLINNKIYFLFGKERDIDENPGWSDFGGGTEKGETFLDTAIREGSEELTGFLGSAEKVKEIVLKYGTYNIDFNSKGHTTYRVHIFPLEYDAMLTYYYNNNQLFLQKKLDLNIIKDTKIFEKTQIKWVSFAEMKKMHKQFRSFYQNIVKLILDNKENITKFLKIHYKFNIKNNNKNNKKITRKNKKM